MSPLSTLAPADRRRLFHELAPACHFDPGELAQRCGISRRRLEQYFQMDLGKPPREWLHSLRLLTAACLFLKHSYSVKEVAHRLGFAHVSAFSRDFKRHFGQSPTQFLKSNPPSVEGRSALMISPSVNELRATLTDCNCPVPQVLQ